MRVKNIYNALYKGIKSLNSMSKGLYVLRMDGDLMLLNDCTRNHIVISTKCEEIELFLTRLSILKDAIFYVTCTNPLTNKEKFKYYNNLLNTKFYGKK